jgi:hypothetical protein
MKEIDLFTEPPSFGHLAIPRMLQSSFLAHGIIDTPFPFSFFFMLDKLILKSRPF